MFHSRPRGKRSDGYVKGLTGIHSCCLQGDRQQCGTQQLALKYTARSWTQQLALKYTAKRWTQQLALKYTARSWTQQLTLKYTARIGHMVWLILIILNSFWEHTCLIFNIYTRTMSYNFKTLLPLWVFITGWMQFLPNTSIYLDDICF